MHHASPRDPVWEYVLGPEQAAECISAQKERVCLIGHSHLALFFTIPDPAPEQEAMRRASPRVARGAGATQGTTVELASARWLLNPGSVGQPRDGDPRAAWLELDTETQNATFHRVEYDIDAAAAEIAATGGLPEQLGRRLYVGQ
jgi:diadenosine tetraphosphatase ApaH/serine/threonine PP2A family protein phosphatase